MVVFVGGLMIEVVIREEVEFFVGCTRCVDGAMAQPRIDLLVGSSSVIFSLPTRDISLETRPRRGSNSPALEVLLARCADASRVLP